MFRKLFIMPPRIQAGDKVAIVSPSAGLPSLFPWVYALGLKRLREVFGLVPIEFPTARQSIVYLANNPQARAEDINQAFADPSIKAIISTIGGNDQMRILPFLNAEIIKENPKPFLGYSDATNMHLYLWNLNIISYYGGAIMTQFAMQGAMDDFTINAIKKALFEKTIGRIPVASEFTDADLDWMDPKNLAMYRPKESHGDWYFHTTHDKIITGRLWGGCLEILDLHFAANKYLPDVDAFSDIVLFIETSEELPSAGFVYRFIASLGERGILHKLKALLVARPKSQFLGTTPPEGRKKFILNQQDAIKQAIDHYGCQVPIVFNLNFGHTDPQLIVPSGGIVTIDCAAKTICFY